MCIVFIYNGLTDDSCEYALIVASNRDEYYNRPSRIAHHWEEDPHVIGGQDLQVGVTGTGGTWLAISPKRRKIGILLNLPGSRIENGKSRGPVVKNYVRADEPLENYVQLLKADAKITSGYVLVALEYSKNDSKICTYTNFTDQFQTWDKTCEGFSNSAPDKPLDKVQEGKKIFEDLCRQNGKSDKVAFIDKIINFLRSDQSHGDEPLSSVYVCYPEINYGTRTHSIILVSKTGAVDFVEVTMRDPIDPLRPQWERTDFRIEAD